MPSTCPRCTTGTPAANAASRPGRSMTYVFVPAIGVDHVARGLHRVQLLGSAHPVPGALARADLEPRELRVLRVEFGKDPGDGVLARCWRTVQDHALLSIHAYIAPIACRA